MGQLDTAFAGLLQGEEEWPPGPPDMKALYTHFYNEIVKYTRNTVCGSCSCIDHDPSHFDLVPVTEHSLRTLRVDPSLVSFNFSSGIEELDDEHIMIDPLGIVQTPGRPSSICICQSCQKSLKKNARPPESLAHFRWVGPIPPELQGLTWIEELLIARAHLNGTIVRLQNRNSHFGLKGHAILLLKTLLGFSTSFHFRRRRYPILFESYGLGGLFAAPILYMTISPCGLKECTMLCCG